MDQVQNLSSVEMEQLFRRVFEPKLEPYGYSFIGKCRWARDTGLGFKKMFYLHPFRPGADYRPYGAVSIDFVPRIEGAKVRIRPQCKHARIHISTGDEKTFVEPGEWWINRQPDVSEAIAQRVALSAIPLIYSWLEELDSIEALFNKLCAQRNAKGPNFYCYPETSLAYAFVLAKLGNTGSAIQELSAVLKSQHFPPETHGPIRQLLARIVEF